jgi:predicted DNA-binding transcriptional regulator YafY
LDPDDPIAVEAFTEQMVRAAKQATARAIADLRAAGIPIAVTDGKGGVILKSN